MWKRWLNYTRTNKLQIHIIFRIYSKAEMNDFSVAVRHDDREHKNSLKQLDAVMAIDLVESGDDFHIHADLPGVEKSEIDIHIENGLVTITATRRNIHEVNEEKGPHHIHVHHVERQVGKVQRSIRIPANADANRARASFNNGVLNLTMPKITPSGPAVKVPVH